MGARTGSGYGEVVTASLYIKRKANGKGTAIPVQAY